MRHFGKEDIGDGGRVVERNIALRAELKRLIGTCETGRCTQNQEESGSLSILVKNLNFILRAVVVFFFIPFVHVYLV